MKGEVLCLSELLIITGAVMYALLFLLYGVERGANTTPVLSHFRAINFVASIQASAIKACLANPI